MARDDHSTHPSRGLVLATHRRTLAVRPLAQKQGPLWGKDVHRQRAAGYPLFGASGSRWLPLERARTLVVRDGRGLQEAVLGAVGRLGGVLSPRKGVCAENTEKYAY